MLLTAMSRPCALELFGECVLPFEIKANMCARFYEVL